MGGELLVAVRGADGEGGRAGEPVHRRPDRVAGHLRRVGEIEEGAAGQGRVEEVLARAAEDFLADDYTEGMPSATCHSGAEGGRIRA